MMAAAGAVVQHYAPWLRETSLEAAPLSFTTCQKNCQNLRTEGKVLEQRGVYVFN